MTREDIEPLLAEIDAIGRRLFDARGELSRLMVRLPTRRNPDRQTQSYASCKDEEAPEG